MRHAVCLVLLVPVLALATVTTRPGTVVAPGVSLRAVTVVPSDDVDALARSLYQRPVLLPPSLGQDDRGNLFVAWEELDGVNVEPTTNRLRADIWYSYSTDNGVTWTEGMKITDGGEVTYRFPSILNPIGDTVMVMYLIDQVAGFFVQSAEGPATNNPVVVQKWANPVAIAEEPIAAPPSRMEIAAGPNPVRSRTVMSYALPRSGDMSLVMYDAAGRPVQTLAAGRRPAGRYTATWHAGGVPAGIYFCTLEARRSRVTRKVILTQ